MEVTERCTGQAARGWAGPSNLPIINCQVERLTGWAKPDILDLLRPTQDTLCANLCYICKKNYSFITVCKDHM